MSPISWWSTHCWAPPCTFTVGRICRALNPRNDWLTGIKFEVLFCSLLIDFIRPPSPVFWAALCSVWARSCAGPSYVARRHETMPLQRCWVLPAAMQLHAWVTITLSTSIRRRSSPHKKLLVVVRCELTKAREKRNRAFSHHRSFIHPFQYFVGRY